MRERRRATRARGLDGVVTEGGARRSGTDVLMEGGPDASVGRRPEPNREPGIGREKPRFYPAPQRALPQKQMPEVR